MTRRIILCNLSSLKCRIILAVNHVKALSRRGLAENNLKNVSKMCMKIKNLLLSVLQFLSGIEENTVA